MAMDNTALVRRFVEEVWNKGNMSTCDELLAPKVKLHDPLMGDVDGIEASRQHVRALRTAFPDLHTQIDEIGALGDKVYVRWTVTGTHKGTLMGVAPTNRRGMIQGITINRFDNGKIVDTFYAWDVYKLIEQLGLLPPLQQFISRQQQPTARV